MSFLVKDADLREALEVCERLKADLGADDVSSEAGIARISAVGKGMVANKGVAARLCSALGDAGINIQMITTSEINISVVVNSADGERALRAVHQAFALDQLPTAEPMAEPPTDLLLSESDTMEGLHVQLVDFDRDQAELKIRGLRDEPGQAGLLLGALADAGINLDIVLQNSCSTGISVTVKRDDVARAKQVVDAMSPRVTDEPAQVSTDIAKLSICGVGLRSHAGAASTVFGVLAREGINIQMIGTSEVKISVIVPEADVERAAAALNAELMLGG